MKKMWEFEEIGSFLGLEDGVLISAPIWQNGTFDQEEICQVYELPKEIIPAVKKVFGPGKWEKQIYTY